MRRPLLAVGIAVTVALLYLVPFSAPALAQGSTPDQLGVAGADSALWVHRTGQTGFTSLAGSLSAAPAVVSVPVSTVDPGSPLYIATGSDHALWARNQTSGWRHLSSALTSCLDNPAAVVSSHFPGFMLTVACQGADHALWLGQAPISPGTIPVLGAFTSEGGALVSGPAIAWMTGFGMPMLFANGTDGRVWTRALGNPPTDWAPMTTVSGHNLSCHGHPGAAAVWVPNTGPRGGTLPAVFACHGTDNGVWLSEWNRFGQGWSDTFTLGGVAVDGVAVAVGPDSATVYVQGSDSRIYQNTVPNDPPRNPSGWTALGGIAQFGTGATALLFSANAPP
jgi:hypothetical protein